MKERRVSIQAGDWESLHSLFIRYGNVTVAALISSKLESKLTYFNTPYLLKYILRLIINKPLCDTRCYVWVFL